MALNRYKTTARVTLSPGAFTADAATGLRFGVGSFAQGAGEYGSGGQVVIPAGTVLMLDPAGPLFTAIGSGNLVAWTGAAESGGGGGTDGVAN